MEGYSGVICCSRGNQIPEKCDFSPHSRRTTSFLPANNKKFVEVPLIIWPIPIYRTLSGRNASSSRSQKGMRNHCMGLVSLDNNRKEMVVDSRHGEFKLNISVKESGRE